jgi:outer membrane protein TolC
VQAVRIVARRRGLELAQASAMTARSLFERNRRAAGRGDASADQLQTAQTAAADAEDKANAAQRDLAAAELELDRLIGLPPTFRLQLSPFIADAGPIDAAGLFAVARANRNDLKALEAGYASQEAVVRKAILDQFPTLGLTVNANRDTAGNFVLGPAIDFTLPLWNRNRGGIAIEQATREALKAEYDARLFQTRAEIFAAASGIEVAQRQRAAALRDIPASRHFAEVSRRSANRGDIALATAETAEQAWRDRELLLQQSEQAIAEQMIALELLTGTLREAWTR